MTIKKTALSTSIILAMGFAVPAFAKTEGMPEAIVDGVAVEIECIPQAEVDLMTAEDQSKLTLPVCEDAGVSDEEKNAEEPKIAQ
jgi:hypothetical protein